MKLIEEIFQKFFVIEENLIPYGFKKDNNKYYYSKLIHNNDFLLEVVIEDNKIDGKLIDKEFNEEYTQINLEVINGSFIASLKEECYKVLIDIRNHCFKNDYFIFPQTNRITELIIERYNVKPEFLWEKFANYGVFRNKRNDKWFGIIMNIPKNKIVGDSDTEIEVINIKVDSYAIKLQEKNGVYPSYHMNKKNWISIILDDTLSDEEVMGLIDISYKIENGTKYWIIPANPVYYDIEHAFDDTLEIIWKQGRGIKENDIVFIYAAKPVASILFMCIVTKTDIPYSYYSDSLSIEKIMNIRLIKRFDKDKISYDVLKRDFGISFIRGPITIDEDKKQRLEKY